MFDLEVSELLDFLGRRDNSQSVKEVELLQVLLIKVFEVPLGEVNVGVDKDLVLGPFDGNS